jgi:hypothetical protein
MLYRICEHYYDENQDTFKNKYNECFICFEYEFDNEKNPIYLQKQNLYLTNCICDGNVHNHCLKRWVDMHKSCPICRINVVEYNITTTIIYNCIPFGIKIYTFIISNLAGFIRIMTFAFFLYKLIEFYFICTLEKL